MCDPPLTGHEKSASYMSSDLHHTGTAGGWPSNRPSPRVTRIWNIRLGR